MSALSPSNLLHPRAAQDSVQQMLPRPLHGGILGTGNAEGSFLSTASGVHPHEEMTKSRGKQVVRLEESEHATTPRTIS